MKRVLLGIGAAAGMLALTACGSAGSAPAPVAPQVPSSSPAPAVPSSATTAKAADTGATPRCTTADLSLSLGTPKESQDAKGQFDVPLTFKNTSARTCGLYGVPGVDLIGPDDPNGTAYHLPREDNGVKYNEVPAGTAATATITVLTPSEGSASWTPRKLVTIPPGQTQPLTAGWPADLPVLRQDSATHPGSYVNGILAG
ncbi:DUF4232 domain-containing protein [Amycolatopsis sp. NPDC088138]|uniref:DUF4232 domain-containing protein n=1 Tax=Amycolatopsis sp. NPDC088138 TaxID=3363938 RepID=UPI003815A67E